jgi:hypothetical protein
MRSWVFALSLLVARGLVAQCPMEAGGDSVASQDGASIVLRVPSVWRDFMPLKNTPDGGSDLMVALSFRNPDSGKVRVSIDVTRAWARYHGDWVPLSVDSPWTSWDSIQVASTARRGPHWPVDSLVDVVVEWQPRSGRLHCTLFRRLRIEEEI